MTKAFVFPGQGSQAVGMGRELYQHSASARAFYDCADALLGLSLTRLCFEGPAEELTQTENAQPALLTTSCALLAALLERAGCSWAPNRLLAALPAGVGATAGHSLGEYSALVAAGALDFATALRLVRRRGELMAQAHEGAMAAILGLGQPDLQQVCAQAEVLGPVVIANQNSPGQLVISGANVAVERAMDLAKQHGAKRAVPINVSAAFHSPLMDGAARQFAETVAEATIATPHTAVISNVSATPLQDAEQIRAELVTQITSPVRWIDSIQHLWGQGVHSFVEIGPGKVLTGLIKRIVAEAELLNLASPCDLETLASMEAR